MSELLDSGLIEELKIMRIQRKPPSELPRYIKIRFPEDTHVAFSCMKYFRASFNLSIKQVSPIVGWYSGELSDQEVDRFLNEELS